MASPLDRYARSHGKAAVAVAVVVMLSALLVAAAAYLLRSTLLSNAHVWGTQLAQSYASEEQSHLSTLEFIMKLGANGLDELVAGKASDEELRERLTDIGTATSESLSDIEFIPYLVLNGQIITAKGTVDGLVVEDRHWYQRAIAADGRMIITDTYEGGISGEPLLTIAIELSTQGDVLALDVPVSRLDGLHKSFDLLPETSYYLFDGAGELLSAATSINLDSPISAEYIAGLYDNIVAGRLADESVTYTDIEGRQRSVFYAELENGWLSVVTIPTRRVLESGWNPTTMAISAMCGGLVIAIVLLLLADRVRAARMRRVTNTLQILGDTFYAIYLVNHARGTYVTIKSAPDTSQLIGDKGTYDHFHDVMRGFVDPRTFELFHESFSTESLHRLALEGVKEYGGEYRRKMNGSLHWVSIRAISNPDLRSDEMIVCFRLVDEEVDQQRQTVELLESSLEAARQSARSKGAFFGSVSHDMRTPVNAIVGLTGLLRESLDDPDRTQHYLDLLEDAGRQLAQLVDDILDITHIESTEGSVLDAQPVDLADVVERTVDLFREQASKAEKNLRLHVNVRHRWVVADARRVRQVLNNLVSNALKYSLAGASVDVTLEDVTEPDASPRRARVHVFRLIVADTGVGMPEDFLPKLFEPFEREEAFAPRGTTGTGLGMPIVKNLVQQMGGEVAVESTLGKGTTFTLTIPFELAEEHAEEEQPADEQGPQKEAPSLAGHRVLVVEDNETNTLITCALLDALGIEAATAGNGREALDLYEAAEPGRFDAILMDMQMPVMDGCEAARAIRALDARIPIIAVTANAFAEDIARAREAGMSDHVTKPISLDALSGALARAWA